MTMPSGKTTLPELLEILEEAGHLDWVLNPAITQDIEALRKICLQYAAWWNDRARPALDRAKPSTVTVIIVLEGGMVQNAYCPDPEIDLEYGVIDYDCEEGGIDGLKELVAALERADQAERQYGGHSSVSEILTEKRAALIRSRTRGGKIVMRKKTKPTGHISGNCQKYSQRALSLEVIEGTTAPGRPHRRTSDKVLLPSPGSGSVHLSRALAESGAVARVPGKLSGYLRQDDSAP